jgi:hypothetical protein
MLRKTGGGFGVAGGPMASKAGLSEAELRLRARPWEATGRVAIDLLVTWALVDQRAGNAVAGLHEIEAVAAGYAWQKRTTLAGLEQVAALGRRIDVSGGLTRDTAHPAALAVAEAVAQHERGDRLARCAREGAPGGWWMPERWLAPMSWREPGVQATVCYFAGKQGAHCPVVQIASLDSIERARADYVEWWQDLCELAWQLDARALGFAIAPPSVVREPWLKGA